MNFGIKVLCRCLGSGVLFPLLSLALFPAYLLGSGQNFELIEDYSDKGSYFNTLRTGLFFVREDTSVWDRLSPFYRNFYDRRSKGSVQVLPERPALKYNLWMQSEPADIVVILPGTGGSHVDLSPTAFAHMFYSEGYSAVVISSAFNWQFMQAAGTIVTPGYTPADAEDVKKAVTLLLAELGKEWPGRIKRKVLTGSSMGALHTLFVADMDKQRLFDRYVAINPPVDMLYATGKLDEYYAIGATWRKEDIRSRMRHCVVSYFDILKGSSEEAGPLGANLERRRDIRISGGKSPDQVDLANEDAKFLIGLSFHLNLVEMLYCIHKFHDTGYFRSEKAFFDQRGIYSELDRINFRSYVDGMLLKELAKREPGVESAEAILSRAGLGAVEQTLRDDSRVRVVHNADDFLLREGDVGWLRERLGARARIFAHGGHLGNLYTAEVRKAIMELASEK
ncbi:MAG: hypothetical protein JW808_05245 [Victivallales bacterium]|nr:hypothetical protein [Victivallales bacterium]